MGMNLFLTLLISVSAVLYIRADYERLQKQVYLFKPLTIGLIILLALLGDEPPTAFYKWAVVAGLLFSLAGDVFLMLPGDRFLVGLVSFLLAHLWYIVAFTNSAGFYDGLLALGVFLGVGTAVYIYLYPNLGKMKIPALLYMLVIITMAWQAFGFWQQTNPSRAIFALFGAVLFMVSDSVLAVNRFGRPFSAAQAIIMSTYSAAQYLIGLSISR
jgi:uncharacterized membrane protein YhhN